MGRAFPLALLFVLVVASLSHGQTRADLAREDASVFSGPTAEMTPDIFAPHAASDVLRVLTVVERVGETRKSELVRVPLFFHAGECEDVGSIVLIGSGIEQTAIPFQVDDVRRDRAGKIARMTVYFETDLAAWQRREFRIMKAAKPSSAMKPVAVTSTATTTTLAGEDLQVTFHTAGPRIGAISAIRAGGVSVGLPESAGPSVTLIRQKADLTIARESQVAMGSAPTGEARSIRWSSGPLFAKLVVRAGPKDLPDEVEYTYRVSRHGRSLTVTQRIYPLETETSDVVGASANAILQGKLLLGDNEADQSIVDIPAGLRDRTSGVFPFVTQAVVSGKTGASLLMIPHVQTPGKKISRGADGRTVLAVPYSFRRQKGSNSETLRQFWGEARIVLAGTASADDLAHLGRAHSQPLVAMVDEPWVTAEHFSSFAREAAELFWKVQNWPGAKDPKPFEALVMLEYFRGNEKAIRDLVAHRVAEKRTLASRIPTPEAVEGAWKNANGAGELDPYRISYSSSAIALIAAFIAPDEGLNQDAASLAQAARLVNGRVNTYGSPHLRSFGNAANMQIGTLTLGVWGGKATGDADLLRWSLAAAQNQAYAGTYGPGQRPYSINVGVLEPSDVLYISNTDFFLRMLELTCNEELSLHPSIYGRYADSIDVNADLYQRRIKKDGGSEATGYRAAMMRGQGHDHRWEAFGCDPYLAALELPGSVAGLTEACYYMHHTAKGTVTWNNLMRDVAMPEILLRKGLGRYKPAKRPGVPGDVMVLSINAFNVVSWTAVEGAAGYRVYRAEKAGGPWVWLNSPYTKMLDFRIPAVGKRVGDAWVRIPAIPGTLVTGTRYEDTSGKPGARYLVTAEDRDGRESEWFFGEKGEK